MPNLHAVHSVGHSLVTWLKNAYPADLRAVTDCEFLLLSSGEMAAKDERGPAVSLWLYRLTVNPHLRNVGRRGDGPEARTPLFLDLHFLLTAWADSALAEHTLIAWAMQRLHDHPLLDLSALSPEGGWTAADQVQVVPEEVPQEELLRLWDALEPKYRLSVPYVVRVVRIDPDGRENAPVVATRLSYAATAEPFGVVP
jgi:hypothetical protein